MTARKAMPKCGTGFDRIAADAAIASIVRYSSPFTAVSLAGKSNLMRGEKKLVTAR
jgi:hypothetical protein